MESLRGLIQNLTKSREANNSSPLSETEESQHPHISYDLADLKQLANQDTACVIQLLQLFLNHAENDFNILGKAADQKNWNAVAAKAHKLIPGCQYLHLNHLVEILQQLESTLKDQPASGNTREQLASNAQETFARVKPLIKAELAALIKSQPGNDNPGNTSSKKLLNTLIDSHNF